MSDDPAATNDASMDPALARRIQGFVDALRRDAHGIVDGVAVRGRDAFSELLYTWESNVSANLEYLERYAGEVSDARRVRAELFRARCDIMRWCRKCSERAEIGMRSQLSGTTIQAPFRAAWDRVDGLGTCASDWDVRVLAPSDSDSWMTRWRKRGLRNKIRRGGSLRPRGVPLSQLARAFVLSAWLASLRELVDRASAIRVLWWRRLHATVEVVETILTRVDDRLCKGEALVWHEVADEIRTEIFQVRADVTYSVEELRRRADRMVNEAERAFAFAALRSDTPFLPRRRYDEVGPTQKTVNQAKDISLARVDVWQVHVQSTCASVVAYFDARAFVSAFAYAGLRDDAATRRAFEAHLVMPTQKLRESVRAAQARIQEALGEEAPSLDSEEIVERYRHLLHDTLEHESLERLKEASTREALLQPLSELSASVKRAASRVGASYEISRVQENLIVEGDGPPSPRLHTIELRSEAQREVVEPLTIVVDATSTLVSQAITEAQEKVKECLRIVDFSLDAARKELQLHEGDVTTGGLARDFATRGLERLATRTDELERWVRDIQSRITDALDEIITRLSYALDEVLPSSGHARSLVPRSAAAGVVTSDESSQTLGGSVSTTAKKEREATHLTPTERVDAHVAWPVELGEAFRGVSLSEQPEFAHIPETYRRLFYGVESTSEQFRVGSPDLIQRFERIVQNWLSGDPESAALVGLHGTGKTSVLTRIADEVLSAFPTVRVRVDERITGTEELEKLLSEALGLPEITRTADLVARLGRDERFAIIVDCGERLFLRHIDGLSAIRSLLSIINATADRVLWIVAFEEAALDFLSSILSLSETFTDVVPIALMSRAELEQLIMVRHSVSGMSIQFDAREFEAAVGDDASLRALYFDTLHAASGGHPTLAMFFWLRSIRQIVEEKSLILGKVRPFHAATLDQLSSRKAAAVATLMLHGGLTLEHFAQCMRISLDEAASLLGQLRHLHLVEQVAGRVDEYAVNRVAYLTVYTSLRQRNAL